MALVGGHAGHGVDKLTVSVLCCIMDLCDVVGNVRIGCSAVRYLAGFPTFSK